MVKRLVDFQPLCLFLSWLRIHMYCIIRQNSEKMSPFIFTYYIIYILNPSMTSCSCKPLIFVWFLINQMGKLVFVCILIYVVWQIFFIEFSGTNCWRCVCSQVKRMFLDWLKKVLMESLVHNYVEIMNKFFYLLVVFIKLI